MCGIYCCISRTGPAQLSEEAKALLQHRGPDCLQQHDIKCNGLFLTFVSSVLSLRGDQVVAQPLVDERVGSVLCWNGEAWSIDEKKVTGNDSIVVFEMLLKASETSSDAHTAILDAFSRIKGPYACVFYDAIQEKLYYGRDCLGRRSLVTSTANNGDLIIASITQPEVEFWTELDASGMYVISLKSTVGPSDDNSFNILRVNATYDSDCKAEKIRFPYPNLNMTVPVEHPESLTLDSSVVLTLEALMIQSMKLRVDNLPGASDMPLGVLFSGGLDSALLAYYAHVTLPFETPIDLLNVAFQNPRIHNMTDEDPYSSCPDRITSISAYTTLCSICPSRKFRLVCVNVPYSEYKEHKDTVMSLMRPHNTEMDLSISSALYFAARGVGKVHEDSQEAETEIYTTPTRVLLSGLGADEMFAGYGRHGIAFDRHGYQALLAELSLDAGRLGKRNLGRDDRVTSHWAREVRYPFLDESVVSWALSTPVWQKCGFTMNPDRPSLDILPDLDREKLILRLLAWKYGLHSIAREKKRAIQFGSRTAKMQSGKSKGTDHVK